MSKNSLPPFCCVCIGGQADSLWNLLGQALEKEKMYGIELANLTGAQLQGEKQVTFAEQFQHVFRMIWQTLFQRNLGYFSLIWDWGGQIWCHRSAFFIRQWLLSRHFTSLSQNARGAFAVNWRADYWWLSSAVKLLMQRFRTGLGWTWVWKVFLYHAGQIYVWILFLFMYFSWPLQLRLHCD